MWTPDSVADDIQSALDDMSLDEGDGAYSDVQNLGGGRMLVTYTENDDTPNLFTIEVKALIRP